MQFRKLDSISKDDGLYFKLTDGQSTKMILRGDIHEFEKDFGKGPKKRFSVNAIISEGGKLHAKIWEFGPAVYGQLSDIHEVYPLPETKIQVTRRGVELDTTYVIMPLLKEAITPSQWEAINSIPLLTLNKPHKEHSEDGDNWAKL